MTSQNMNIEIINSDKISLTFDRCTFWQLRKVFEELSDLSQTSLGDKQQYLHFALNGKIKERPDMADGYLSAMNFTDTAIRVFAGIEELSNDLWQVFEEATEKIE